MRGVGVTLRNNSDAATWWSALTRAGRDGWKNNGLQVMRLLIKIGNRNAEWVL